MTPEQIFQYGFPAGLILLAVGMCAKYLPPIFAFLAQQIRDFNTNIATGFREIADRMEKTDSRWQGVVKQMHDDHNAAFAKLHDDHRATMATAIAEIRADRQEDRKVRHNTNEAFQAALLKVGEEVEKGVTAAVEHKPK